VTHLRICALFGIAKIAIFIRERLTRPADRPRLDFHYKKINFFNKINFDLFRTVTILLEDCVPTLWYVLRVCQQGLVVDTSDSTHFLNAPEH
jgi:hypothetical protein